MAAALERALGSAGPGTGPVPEVPEVSEPVLVLGPAGSGRTALLLQAALAGGAHGPRALFLAPSAVPRLPNGGGGTGTDPRALQVRGGGRWRCLRGGGGGWRGGAGNAEWAGPRVWAGLCVPPFIFGVRVGACPDPCSPSVPTLCPPPAGATLPPPPPAPHVLPTLRRFFPARCLLSPRPGGLVGVRLSRTGRSPQRWRLCLDSHGEGGKEEQDEEEEEGEEGIDTEEEWG
ncbi:uncharacterized protein LOC113941336 [Corapipo altera]|uniref:uncharacterized protein LOC113941336 n=1 Tax=Corapipo altera TaxID=415028 RepID=UPI000FD6629B|nr:uncharacterized protein LOC113941336 [Corapipo altera]